MKEITCASIAGIMAAAVKFVVVSYGLTLWDISLVSYSGLIAGMFFIMAMTFQASLRDYKRAETALGSARGLILSMNDINMVAVFNSNGKYKPETYNKHLIALTKTLKEYMLLKADLTKLHKILDNLNRESWKLHKHITMQQQRTILVHQGNLREACSQLAFIKDLKFPTIGYHFLYGFSFILIGMQLLAHSQNLMLELVFIFTLTAVLAFFADLIADLDDCFGESSASYVADTIPLDNCVKALKESLK